VKLDVDSGDLSLTVIRGEHEGEYKFSEYSTNQALGVSYTALGSRMLANCRDSFERERVGEIFKHRWFAWQKQKGEKQAMLRLRDDGGVKTVRALLSDSYQAVDHRFIAGTLGEMLGGDGLISHFDVQRFSETGGDFCRYNVLLPDSLRSEDETEFGAMWATSNSEVGNGRYSVLPSIFRSICLNGCIWGQRKDKAFLVSRVHKGSLDFPALRREMIKKLNEATPLLNPAIERMLNLRNLSTGEGSVVGCLGYVATELLGFNKHERKDLFKSYLEEQKLRNESNAYLVLNSITRYAQQPQLSLERQSEIEEKAGGLLESWNEKESRWESVVQQSIDEGYEEKYAGILAS